ncbi:MAG: hypothetical protein RR290_04420 [Clostridia bacterium]
MKKSNKKVEQLTIDNTIIEDYGEILSKNELKKILQFLFTNLVETGNYLYGEYKNKKYCLYYKNISYLGTPHQHFKKRIQIGVDFKELYKQNIKYDIKTLLIGIYKYKDNILLCDFDTTKYINNKVHNSSAHLYSIDLLNGKKNGLFKKTDIRKNIITVFDRNNVDNYLLNKLFNNNNGIEIFDTLDAFFISIAKEWFGIDCYLDMIEHNFNNKNQPEWPGFYLEYKLNQYLEENHKKDIILYLQNKKKGEVDLDLFFPKLGYFGDLKAHSISSSGIQGNDYNSVMKLLETQSIYYVVCNHTTVRDRDYNYKVTNFWNNQLKKDNLLSYGNKMKYSVKIKSYYILELNKYNRKYIDIFNQGINSNGKFREPKIIIKTANLGNFIIHVLDLEENK